MEKQPLDYEEIQDPFEQAILMEAHNREKTFQKSCTIGLIAFALIGLVVGYFMFS